MSGAPALHLRVARSVRPRPLSVLGVSEERVWRSARPRLRVARRKGSYIRRPAVIGAVIQLGNFFDLLDVRFTRELSLQAARLVKNSTFRAAASLTTKPPAPATSTGSAATASASSSTPSFFTLSKFKAASFTPSAASFSVFQEGEPAFRGAGIKLKSHIQIAIRDPRALIGYFRPDPATFN